MAGPITWRNIGGGGINPASFLGGQDSMESGVNLLTRYMEGAQKQAIANVAVAKENNTQAFLDQVAAAGGPEALADPTVRAGLEEARLGYGPTINQGVARNAVDERLGDLQLAATATQKYADEKREVEERPKVAALFNLYADGKFEEAAKYLDENNLMNTPELQEKLVEMKRAKTNDRYAAEDQTMQWRAEGRAAESHGVQMSEIAENRANTREDRKRAAADRDVAKFGEYVKNVGLAADTSFNTANASNPFAVDQSKDPKTDALAVLTEYGLLDEKFDPSLSPQSDVAARNNMIQSTTELMKNGIPVTTADGVTTRVRIPISQVKEYLAANANSTQWGSDPGQAMIDHFTTLLASKNDKGVTELANRAVAGQRALDKHNQTLKALQTKGLEMSLANNPNVQKARDDVEALVKKTNEDMQQKQKEEAAEAAKPKPKPVRPVVNVTADDLVPRPEYMGRKRKPEELR